ncbi:MAG TPA: Fe-S-containing hydro-lyase [Dehalococcoidia bacterium]|nr:Fe-S-containing hydro-lyase [Dehalococcoidia bacterium]
MIEKTGENEFKLSPPLTDEDVLQLKVGDRVRISGTIYGARDAAHKRFIAALDNGEELPFDVRGQIIYYVGPTPARPGRSVGSAGPTTAGRLDPFTPRLLDEGLKAAIGKSNRGEEVRESLKKNKAVYFLAIGGAGALLSRQVKNVEVIAYEDLGTESVKRFEVEDFPVIVCDDAYGNDLLWEGRKQYRDLSKLEGYQPSEKMVISGG